MPERTEEPISGAAGERVKAGSPESSDCDSTDGSAKDPSLIPKHTDLGKRVLFFSSHDKKEKYGVLRFLGETEFAEGVWCGIELDKQDGKNNGSIHGIRYFTCEPNYGVFVPLQIVELDPSRRSRSRPNSAPSSRTPSADRGTKKAKTMTPAAAGGGGSGKPHFILQQELVTRLSTPALQKRKQGQSPASSRGPMRAFATKGVDQPLMQHNRKKAAFTSFKSGEIKKAVSTDNLKSLKDKKSQSSGLTTKKSSSHKDLRSSSASSVAVKGMSSSPQGSGRRKPQRASSYSDLFDENSSPAYGGGGGVGGGAKTKSKATSDAKLKRNSDILSMSKTQIYDWPRTSTPGDRNDQTPDGCSSPEGVEMSDTHSTTSSSADTMSSCYEKMETDTPGTQERGFIATPVSSPSMNTSSVNGSMSLDSPPTGLVTPASQFVRNERKSPSIDACRVASPDGSSAHPKQVYKNRPSGTATLPHPLTLQTAGSLANGCEDNYLHTPTSFMEHFLGPNTSAEGVSVPQLLEALREHCQQWHSAQVQSEIRIKTLEQELAETKSRFQEAEKSHRAELSQVKKELASRAHKFEDQVRVVNHTAV